MTEQIPVARVRSVLCSPDPQISIQRLQAAGFNRDLAEQSGIAGRCRHLASSISAAQMFPVTSPALNKTLWRVIEISSAE